MTHATIQPASVAAPVTRYPNNSLKAFLGGTNLGILATHVGEEDQTYRMDI
jgi:hypothetical protein